MKLLKIVLIASIVFVSSLIGEAQELSAGDAAIDQGAPNRNDAGFAPVVFWNRTITIFHAPYEEMSPAERARKAIERLDALPEATAWDIVARETTSGRYSGAIITVNGSFAFAILSGDLDSESQQTLQAASNQAVANLRGALEARSQQRHWRVLLKGIGLSLVASLILALGLWLVIKAGDSLLKQMDQSFEARGEKLKLAGLDLRPFLHGINRGLTKLTMWSAAIVMLYVWLTFVLLRFRTAGPGASISEPS